MFPQQCLFEREGIFLVSMSGRCGFWVICFGIIVVLLAGCGGGGDGGGPVPGVETVTVSGLVMRSDGGLLSGATVEITSASKGTLVTTTDSNGKYSLQNVPVSTDLTLSVKKSGMQTKTWTGLKINTAGMSVNVKMYIVLPGDPIPVGSSVMMNPRVNNVALEDTLYLRAQVRDASGFILYDGYPVIWTVVGDIPSDVPSPGPYYGRYLILSAKTVGMKSRITVSVAGSGGALLTDTIEVTVVSGGGPVEPPPPPPNPPT